MFLVEKILKSYLGQVQEHGTNALDFRLRTRCRGIPDSSGPTFPRTNITQLTNDKHREEFRKKYYITTRQRLKDTLQKS